MKRRNLLKGALATSAMACTSGRIAMAAIAPASDSLHAVTLNGGETLLSRGAVNQFQNTLKGQLLLAQNPAYDAARMLWNAMFDRYPTLIAQCVSAADVASAVRFGREHNLLTSVRCGGHSFSGKSAVDGGLMIDLGFIHQVDVDPKKLIARTGGGARLGHLDLATLKHNLATVVGTDSDTGAGGLTLGGGIGRLNRKWGLTIDNLLSAQLVTADGELHEVSAENNPDLFWAIRGGGGNFGVVTRFDYALHDFNPMVFGGDVMWPWKQRKEVMKMAAEVAENASDELFIAPFLFNKPGEGTESGPGIGIEVIYAGDHKDGEKAVAALRRFGKPEYDGLGPTPYIDRQTTKDTETRLSHYIKTGYVASLTDDVIEATVDEFPEMPGVVVFFHQMGGAVGRVDPQATAFSHRDAGFAIGVKAAWKQASEFKKYRQVIRQHYSRLEPHTVGFYNNLMNTTNEGRMTDNYAINLARLERIKGRYDPDNFFRMNANIEPRTS